MPILRNIILLFFISIFLSNCSNGKQNHHQNKWRQDFSPKEQKILQVARNIMSRAYFGSLITINKEGSAKARLMEPFAPEKNFVIYLATNPKSRKVHEIQHNHQATLHYIDEPRTGYVSLYGKIFIETNDSVIKAHWKKGWEKFYPHKNKDYLLLKFIPDYLELISIPDSLTGNTTNWQPERVNLYK